MLPGGLLASHGYSVKWNSFVGVCPGSHNLPFEQSADLARRNISNATLRLGALETRIAEHDAGIGALMFHRYVRTKGYQSRYVWTPVASLEMGGESRWISHVVFADGTKERPYAGQRFDRDLRDAFIRYLRSIVDQEQRYIDWQTKRVADWAPRALTPRAREVG